MVSARPAAGCEERVPHDSRNRWRHYNANQFQIVDLLPENATTTQIYFWFWIVFSCRMQG
jgi:hypothetical protein